MWKEDSIQASEERAVAIESKGWTIGDELKKLRQGVHESVGSGHYFGSGVYRILMQDGGKDRRFNLSFRLTRLSSSEYEVDRIDTPEIQRVTDDGKGVLTGGPYRLEF